MPVVTAAVLLTAQAHAIVGGRPATGGEFPWVAAVIEQGEANAPIRTADCGGTLIAPRVVLTAGHCVTALGGEVDPTRAGRVILGRRDLRTAAGETHAVVRIVRHPYYNDDRLLYDLALLELAEPAAAPPLALAPQHSRLREGQSAAIVGWGSTTDGGRRSPVLRTARVQLVSNRRCTRAYRGLHVSSLMLCAASRRGTRDVCDGDSGGPLVLPAAGRQRRLLGVASFGYAAGCAARRYPTNFAWVTSPLIRSWVARRSAALGRGEAEETPPRLTALRRTGDTLQYALSEPAEVVLSVERRRSGRTVGLPTTLVAQGKAGANVLRLPPATRRRLQGPGAFRLQAFATDAAGNLSPRVTTGV